MQSKKGPQGTRKPLAIAAGFAILMMSAALVACGGGGSEGASPTSQAGTSTGADTSLVAGYPKCPAASASTSLTGAGATFPFPLYSKWIDQYSKECRVKIDYQSVGSGAGIQQITAKTVDFGASDGILSDDQDKAATAAGGPILMIPMTLGPEAVVVNLPGVQTNQLKLTPDVLADIYLKKITKWNDQRVTSINTGTSLPNADITVVHRSDGSGTTFIFTNYLSKVSPEWQTKVGFANSVNWPGDVGGQGNEGVAGQVKQLVGSIGYVELAYATQNNLVFTQMKNKAGNFVSPTLENAANAAVGVVLPDDMRVLITDSSNPQAYPIAGFTWVLAYANAQDAAKGKTLASYLWWAIHDGQKLSAGVGYAAMSADAVKKAEAEILKLMCGSAPCLTKS
jgi:phosphate transport system substrate-binding protein